MSLVLDSVHIFDRQNKLLFHQDVLLDNMSDACGHNFRLLMF